uniref:ZAD domain-containing protein n=1 Tax=Anopheles stephensi TaxID=30069 RepID=A0A182YL18_ANOST
MVDAEQRRDDTPCRLCLESIASLETAGVDLLENTDVKKLLHDVYELKVGYCALKQNVLVEILYILPNDNKSTMMCMPCYQQLMHHYTLRMKLLMLRKTFRINQTMMLTQINAFSGKRSGRVLSTCLAD